MPALTIPLPAVGAVALVVDAACRPCCTACGRAVAILVVRLVGTRLRARCLACDGAPA